MRIENKRIGLIGLVNQCIMTKTEIETSHFVQKVDTMKFNSIKYCEHIEKIRPHIEVNTNTFLTQIKIRHY